MVNLAGNILIVDDEPAICALLAFNLDKAGYHTVEADNGHMALELTRKAKLDLIILDVMLPGIDGMEVCRILKGQQQTAGIPIIMLTAKNDEIDKIIGLELGADDYMTKPFSPRELVARVKAVLRRSHKENLQDGQLVVGKLKMNFTSYEVRLENEKMELTPKEYELLKLFITNIGRAYTREQLLEKVWGYEYFGDTRTVDVHVRHLRAKLGKFPEVAEAIETVRGVGYRFSEI